jgi:dihydroorotase
MDTTTSSGTPAQLLRLVGGEVFDAEGASLSSADVTVQDGTVVEHGTASFGKTSNFDVTGCIVAPGLVDLHTHVFRGQRHSVDARSVGPAAGTTTMVDAGSAGAQFISAFRITTYDDDESPQVRAFLNISAIGTAAEFRGELRGLAFCDEEAALEAVEENRDFLVGIKVRASADVGGSDVVEALGRARRVADAAGLPLMCHLGPAPATLGDILGQLREGDVLTHCFTGFGDNHVARTSRTLQDLIEAASRGVILDVGHGQSGFSFRVASAALEAGILPTTISTDLHRGSVAALGDSPS